MARDNTREITLRFLAEPGDVNFGGKVHGGAVMKWIDQAGYACAVSWSGHYCVTVYVGGIRFLHPILIGHLVEVTAKVIHTGRTSMHIALQVRAGDPRGGELTETTHCTMVFVAVSSTGASVPVHRWVPVTAEDKALEHQALKQMELRQGMEASLVAPPG
ncbi:MAG: acyl-CoA thioesterase [Lacunisphaera sp.]|nr:acyl-CoA thioesterase [Lacunisphaera sp.]